MKPLVLLLLAPLAVLHAVDAPAIQNPKSKIQNPNILFIVADDRGFTGPMVKDYFTHAQQKGTAKGLWHNSEPLAVGGHATDIFTGWAVDYVRSFAESDKPFFL